MKKREFIKTIGLAGLALPFSVHAHTHMTTDIESFPDPELPDAAFWAEMRKQYTLKSDYINLENGYYNFMPDAVLKTYIENVQKQNLEASYYMRTGMEAEKERIRAALAGFLQCATEELIITRNTTESMDTVISGTDWKTGDEAIMAEQEYGAMLDMFKQVSRRYGMVNKMVSLPLHPASDEEIVDLYQKAISPKTRMILLSHMVNISGQILPVRKICDMAHERGIKVLVDGAHAVAHFGFKISDLNCDYYAASLHKWLSVPLGAGLLWVRKDHIKELWPLFGESAYPDHDIRKLNHTGTGPVHVLQTIPAAIAFYNKIGSGRKENRLRFLQTYWTEKVRGKKNIVLNTPEDPARSCAIANVGITGKKPADVAKFLFEKTRIWTVAIDGAGVHGCRITPNVYTSTDELDVLVRALLVLSGN